MPPQTPPAIFALKAFRTTLFGTPAPPKFDEKPPHKRTSKPNPHPVKEKKDEVISKDLPLSRRNPEPLDKTEGLEASGNPIVQPIPFKITKKPNLFDTSSISTSELPPNPTDNTPVRRPVSPTKGILMTPGTAVARKKAVTFHPSVPTATTPPNRNGHIRSGLPHEFPGKFPSPWTPKVSTASHHQRSASWSDPSSSRLPDDDEQPGPADKAEKGKQPQKLTAPILAGYYEVNEDSRIGDFLDESEGDEDIPEDLQEVDATTDMEVPRSNSGKYWKERTEKIEGLALSKVDRLKTRCRIATGYAKQKDELCVNLSERIREFAEKNRRLKIELKRLSASTSGAPSTATGYMNTFSSSSSYTSHALEQAMHIIREKDAELAASNQERERMDGIIEGHREKLRAFEEMLDQRENKITELSMSMFNGDDDQDLEEVVANLRKKLKSAKLEAKEYGLVRLEAKNLRERVDGLERGYVDVTTEKDRLQRELDRMKSIEVEGDKSMSRIRSSVENRLRAQVEGLEKARKDLRAELREKSLNEAKEKRESERKWRAELAEAKGKTAAAEWEKEKLDKEIGDLREYTGRLERELERTRTELDELRKSGGSSSGTVGDDIREWQTKQRTTVQELRKAKEENCSLRTQKSGVADQLRDAKKEIEKLRLRLTGATNIDVTTLPTTSSQQNKEPESASDDSAVDRSFDRRNRPTTSPPPVPSTPRSRSPAKLNSPSPKLPTFSFAETPKQTNNKPLNPDTESSLLLPDLPPDTPVADSNEYTNFQQQRKQKASPRASIVNIAPTPPSSNFARKVTGVGKVAGRRVSSGVGAAGGGVRRVSSLAMDPARKAAAERRLAERRRVRGAAAAAGNNA
ncbi:unnamed protein product [Tuber melanosporum]|uniref:(Perigord truffle) hypothetical protein n=1 Tax=Tuber melanosporum (strain Mel28) TaxID=656061 RepID=D5GEE2_TUBMM|nr:uncharacterized protein GSTUM_00006441001 [Tuber melanosporum]CAZ82885.1 unnamed protein product [Tuber melanosporum]